jgi:phenylacetate-CoA ligase
MNRLVKAFKLLKLGDAAVRRNPWFYADAQKALAQLESADLPARRDWTRSRLEAVLWSARNSPYGKRVRGTKDLHTWPLLDKAAVQTTPIAFCAHSRLLSVAASTGGTSGAPLRLFRSLRSIAFEQACLDHMMHKLGAHGRDARTAVLRTDAIKDPNDFQPPYWVYGNGGNRMVFSSSHLNAATVATYAQALSSFDPDVLMGYPTSLESLCMLLERTGTKLHLKRVLCSSEMLSPRVWQEAQRLLGCALLDYYGQAERVAFAYAMTPGEYRFLPGYAHVELEQVGVEDDQNVYEIVGTSLWNLSMPLVRYRTADLIRVPSSWGAAELEELSLGLRTFSGVLGRSGDILLTPEGVKVTGISHFQRDVPHVMRIQVIQESQQRVRILVLAGAQYSAHDEEKLTANVRSKLPQSMQVEIVRAESLERTALGKTPFVIHRPAVKALLQQARTQHGGHA